MKLLKELLAGFITVLKIPRNSSFRSHWKHDQRKQQVSLCLILIYQMFSVQFVTTRSQFTLSESNGLVYKPDPRFLAQNLSKKVRLIHESLRYVVHLFNMQRKVVCDSLWLVVFAAGLGNSVLHSPNLPSLGIFLRKLKLQKMKFWKFVLVHHSCSIPKRQTSYMQRGYICQKVPQLCKFSLCP